MLDLAPSLMWQYRTLLLPCSVALHSTCELQVHLLRSCEYHSLHIMQPLFMLLLPCTVVASLACSRRLLLAQGRTPCVGTAECAFDVFLPSQHSAHLHFPVPMSHSLTTLS